MTRQSFRLFCFPFAGGSSYSYTELSKALPGNIELVPIELPGRGRRTQEPLLTDIHAIVVDVYEKLKENLNEPYAFFGHSMGALISYLLTCRISKDRQPLPTCLFVSGRGGPSKYANRVAHNVYLLPREEFIREIVSMGGIPDEIVQDEEVFAFFELILRSDFQAVENYVYEGPVRLNVPIIAMIGRQEKVSLEDAQRWATETSRTVNVHEFDGGHFYIFKNMKGIADIISTQLLHRAPIYI